MEHKVAEEIFKLNIGKIIQAEVFSNEENFKKFQGKLISISCNTFIITNNENSVEMFRYEDVRSLKVINE